MRFLGKLTGSHRGTCAIFREAIETAIIKRTPLLLHGTAPWPYYYCDRRLDFIHE